MTSKSGRFTASIDFLRRDEMFLAEGVVHRTAFFRRTGAPAFPTDADGWEKQALNARELLRYTWRERLKAWFHKRRWEGPPRAQDVQAS